MRLIRRLAGLLGIEDKRSVWVRGEDCAAHHMKRCGYRIVGRNVRLGIGEIDLVCEEPRTGMVVVVEVKARLCKPGDTKRVDPEANITHAKKAKLRSLTLALTKGTEFRGRAVRIDVIALVFVEGSREPVELRHYESAV